MGRRNVFTEGRAERTMKPIVGVDGGVTFSPTPWEYATARVPGVSPRAEDWSACGVPVVAVATEDRTEPYPSDLDATEHWFGRNVVLDHSGAATQAPTFVHVGGVATIAEFYWNGTLVGASESMFSEHMIDVSGVARDGVNRFEVRCLSLTAWLADRKFPKSRWKTRIVEEQKLRGVRTTLLGRATGWSPPTTVVGIWGGATVFDVVAPVMIDAHWQAGLADGIGRVSGECDILLPRGLSIAGASLVLSRSDDDRTSSECSVATNPSVAAPTGAIPTAQRWVVSGSVTVAEPMRWWPHTHGTPDRYRVALRVSCSDGTITSFGLGSVGFRAIEVDRGTDGEGFGLVVNGVPVFVRGGAWFPLAVDSFQDDPDALRKRLTLVRDGGHNMVRISGTVGYGSPTFYELCDELGLLVWQDLAFANFDYPTDDAFLETVRSEVAGFLRRTSLSPALCVVAGSSELQQQAAMMGIAAPESVKSALTDMCRATVSAVAPDLVFVDSSPTGGFLPFLVDVGVSHYYGVGAYRRPLSDARTAGVRFTSECLAFSNIPVTRTVRLVTGDGAASPTNPQWKERVPRDRGTAWDFEDIRDFYVTELFGLDPREVRYADAERYLAIGRAATCEVIERTLGEWRRPASTCQGALLWTMNDLWPGAGWGLLDSTGIPKAAYWGAKRALAPVGVVAIDEGLNGLDVHLFNDGPVPVAGTLRIQATRGQHVVFTGEVAVTLGERSHRRVKVDEVFGRFTDPTYAYKFGPRSTDAVSGRWTDPQGNELGRFVYVPPGEALTVDPALELSGHAKWVTGNAFELRLSTNRLARYVTVDAGASALSAADDHLALVPGDPYVLRYVHEAGPLPKRVYVSSLNGQGELAVPIGAMDQPE